MLRIPAPQNWRKILSRGKYPLLFIYELNHGLLGTHQVTGFKVRMESYLRGWGSSYISEKEAQAFIRELRYVLQKNPRKTLIWIKEYFKHTRKLFRWLKKINSELKKQKLSKAALKKRFKEYEKQMLVIWRWGYLPFLIDDAIAFELNDLLIKLGLQPEKISEAFKILTVSSKLTLHQQEELKLLELAIKVRRYGVDRCQQQIHNHWRKWLWKQSWIYSQHDLTLKDLEKIANTFIHILTGIYHGRVEYPERKQNSHKKSSKKNPVQIILKLKRERAKRSEARKKFLAKFKNERLGTLADILSEYAFWHSYKMEELTRAVYLVRPLLSQLANELGLSYDQFVELIPQEVEKEKINLKIINERLKGNGIIMLKGQWQAISGKRLEEVRKIMEQQPSGLKTLSGFAVFPGKVEGRAIIASETINILKAKIKVGEILIVPMTTTNMVPLVKKAAAVVTDEGGVLCHAAIIARALKKPCIIGTKFATKVFKTGDRVQVDAYQGIVRKLN